MLSLDEQPVAVHNVQLLKIAASQKKKTFGDLVQGSGVVHAQGVEEGLSAKDEDSHRLSQS